MTSPIAALTGSAVRVTPGTGLTVEQMEFPPLPADRVLLRTAYGGICGSDLHYARHGANGQYVVTEPLTLGHEISGVIEAIGDAVSDAPPPGTAVTVHPAWPVSRAGQRRSGLHTTAGGTYLGSASTLPHTQGGFAAYVTVRPEQLRVLPRGLSLRTAALTEPTAVALHAVEILGPDALRDKRVLVTGCGPIGLLTVLAAAQHHPAEVIACDVSERAVSIARGLGATAPLIAPERLPAGSADVVIEASGAPSAINEAFSALATGGTLLQLAIPAGAELSIPIAEVLSRELTIKGTWRFDGEMDDALAFLAAHPETEQVVSHEFAVEDAPAAFELANNARMSSKVLLKFF